MLPSAMDAGLPANAVRKFVVIEGKGLGTQENERKIGLGLDDGAFGVGPL